MTATCTHPATVTVTVDGDPEDDRALAGVPDNISTWADQVWWDRWQVTVRCDDCGAVPTVTAWEDHPDSDGGDPEFPYWNGSVLTLDWATEGARRVSLRL